MTAPETFDAFYARTAWNVTSQMHSVTGQDSDADHAVREAYARAYQQWYEVSGYRDPEAWVLNVAEEAYHRRRAQAAAAGLGSGPVANADPGTWPGIYRPRTVPKQGTTSQDPAGEPAGLARDGIAVAGGAIGGNALADGGLPRRGVGGSVVDADGGAPYGTALAGDGGPGARRWPGARRRRTARRQQATPDWPAGRTCRATPG